MNRRSSGFALLAVLVALSILLALTAPFLLSMGHGESFAAGQIDRVEARLAAESMRDLVLRQTALGHRSIDETPLADGSDEFPDAVAVPKAFAALSERGRQLLSAECYDLQRRINLTSISPLVLANLLGLYAKLSGDHGPDADKLVLEDGAKLPPQGWVVADRELIKYTGRDGNVLTGLTRGLLGERGFKSAADHQMLAGMPVLDYRVILAATWAFDGATKGDAKRFVPFGSVDELPRIGEAGYGTFSAEEMDVLRRTLTCGSMREDATEWGHAERVFSDLRPGDTALQVRSVQPFGGGTVVRLRTRDGKKVEHGLVWSNEGLAAPLGTVNLRNSSYIHLVNAVTTEFPALETCIEPLVPHPVNVNTATPEVLQALALNLRQALRGFPQNPEQRQKWKGYAPSVSSSEAQALATDIVTLRERVPGAEDKKPFDGFEDFVKRIMKPRFVPTDPQTTERMVLIYRALLNGRDGSCEFSTAPICFASAPVVAFRAAAGRNYGSGVEAARHELSGTAQCMPGTELVVSYLTQDMLEEAFRLDREAPWYLTWPINTGASSLFDSTTPVSRVGAHVNQMAYPQAGFSEPRFPARDPSYAGFRAGTVNVAPPIRNDGPPAFRIRQRDHESMGQALDPDGRDIGKQGPYKVMNSGPTGSAAQQPQKNQSHDRIAFRLSTQGGYAGRHAVSFWFKLEDGGDQVLYDYAADQDLRDRISLRIEKGHLVYEILDAAGLDPEPSQSGTQPERSAGTWRVPLTDFAFQPNTWFHATISAEGNRPGQLMLLVDGVPRNKPQCRTYLAGALPVYHRDTSGRAEFWEDKARYPDLVVESTEGFPDRGVLRIGTELFEYTKKQGNIFKTEFDDSFGGRAARMQLFEWRPPTDLDDAGMPRPRQDDNLDVAPEHKAGEAVELYGYSLPLHPDMPVLYPGSARLDSALGAFAVARVVNSSNLKPVDIQITIPPSTRPISINIGTGFDENSNDDIELGNPEPSGPGESYPPKGQPNQRIAQGFCQTGGYALLVQRRSDFGDGVTRVGGVEVIRYSARQGNKLTGIRRGQTIPGVQGRNDLVTGVANKYVLNWRLRPGPAPKGPFVSANEQPYYLCYVVPISVAVPGAAQHLPDPVTLGLTEWMQIYDGKGDLENETEWVRFNAILDGVHVTRASASAWQGVLMGLSSQTGIDRITVAPDGSGTSGALARFPTTSAEAYGTPLPDQKRRIGYRDPIEVDYPAVAMARQFLAFRGDPFTGTTSHAHQGNAMVLPVHRMELSWYQTDGALTGRVGRNDRIALVNGRGADSTGTPSVDWQIVNWQVRRYDREPAAQANQRQGSADRFGPLPFQLVAFKDGVRAQFGGTGQRSDDQDSRLVDRILKYPSGELPSAYAEEGWFGGTVRKDFKDARGIVDEIDVVEHQFPRSAQPLALVLDAPIGADAKEFKVALDRAANPIRTRSQPGVGNTFPPAGGLVRIDGELLAYATQEAGVFTVARSGRGLLTTEPRPHAKGALVYFLDEMPAAILTDTVSPTSATLQVASLNELPKYGGTLLVRDELLHYCWTNADTSLEMPKWTPPDSTDETATRGLFRGRFGTTPVSAESGEAVIFFPCRFWDRWHERADDPEMAHLQVTLNESPVWMTGITWEVEQTDPLVELHCMVRVDGRSSWSDDPKKSPGLFLFEKGKVDDKPNTLGYQGSRIEARFATIYKPGAFDGRQFLKSSWKTAPFCKSLGISFEGQTRVLTQMVSAR